MSGKLLLHCCCAPCSVAIIDELRHDRELAVLFYNPNLHPIEEYERRKTEVTRVCREWGIETIDHDHAATDWEAAVSGIPQEQEGGSRCSACYRLRLERTAGVARELGFSQFATSLSSGRQKKSAVINAIGHLVAAKSDVPFLDVDWKKGGRQERSRELVREMGIYRQDYCGCRFSLAERDARPKSA